MKWTASHEEVVEAEQELSELGTLVAPRDRARAVTGGCAVKIVAAVASLQLATFGVALGLLAAEHVHWGVAVGVGLLGAGVGLLLPVGVANAAIRALYVRAARRARSTPRLGSVSSGSSTAIPSIESGRGQE